MGRPLSDRVAPGRPWIAPADRRVGILGGTFDPIHYGHLAIAEQVTEALSLDRVLFIPASEPPHKPGRPISAPNHRVRMVELAIEGNPRFEMSRIEMERPGPSFSVDTLEELTAEAERQGVERELIFILSTEALAGLPAWRDPWRLLTLCRLAVVPRAGHAFPDRAWFDSRFPGRAARFECVETTLLTYAASEIRARVASGRSVRYLVPPAVETYIRDHRLYRSDITRNIA